MKVVTRIRIGQIPSSHPEVNQSEFAIPSAGHSPTFEEIQLRAYEIHLTRGGPHGNDLDDWLQALRELTEEHGLGTKTKETVD